MNGLGVDISRFGTTLEETRKLVGELSQALRQRRRERPEAVTPVTPNIFGKEDIGQYGAEVDKLIGQMPEGWMFRIGSEGELETFISPGGIEKKPEEMRIYEGKMITLATAEALERGELGPEAIAMPMRFREPEGVIATPAEIEELARYAEADTEAFFKDILDVGRTPETEAFLEGLGASEEEIDTIFAPLLITTPVAKRRLGDIQTYYEHLARAEETQDTALIERAKGSIYRELDSIYKEGRTDENVALLRFLGFTDAEMDEFFVTPEVAIKKIVEELYVPESKMKDIWDAFHLGAQRMWHQSKGYFVSAFPEWVLRSIEPPEEGFPGRLWSQESRDAFKDRFSQTYLEQDEKYAEWLLAHPELSPRPEWVGGVIENVKRDPSLIRDPAYWGYIAAESGAFMLAVIGTTMAVGAATRNPWLALSAGVAVATPSQSQDLYEDLIMSGATPEQAAGLSIPIGVAISMVEVAGDFPFLRAMSPAFKGLLHKNVTTALVQGATQNALRRGLITIGKIEAAEILEEIAQGAIQDATVKTVDENREILANVSEIAIRTAIATVPLALIGGANVARVTHRLNLEQRNNFNETRDRFLKEGLSDYEATQRALADLYLTPEGQRVIAEVTEELELAAKQEAELAKLQVEPPATFEPDIVPIVEPVELTIPPTEGIINASIEPNLARTLFRAITELPGGKSIVSKIDPRALVPHAPETIADAVDKNAIVWREIVKAGQGVSAIKLGSLQAITTNPVKLFGFNENAYSGKMVARLLTEHKGTIEAGTLEHVFTHPEMYNWTRFRKGLEYVTTTHKIYGDVLWLLRKEGVAPEHVTEGWWIHRVVEGKYDADNELVEVRGRPGMRGRFAAKRAYEMRRKAPTMYEGMVWKIKYAANPTLGVSTFIEEAYRKIANARFYEAVDKDLDAIGKAGQLPSEILKERYPEIAERAEVMAERSKDLGSFHKVISRAVRGEITPTQTLKAIEARFPELGKRLRILVSEPSATYPFIPEAQELLRKYKPLLKGVEQIDVIKNPEAYNLAVQKLEAFTETLSKDEWGILDKALEAETLLSQSTENVDAFEYPLPVDTGKDVITRREGLEVLRKEVKVLAQQLKPEYWKARYERAAKMEIVSQPSIGEGYVFGSHFGGKIYDQAFIDAVNKFMGHDAGLKLLRYTSNAAGILRVTKAAFDFSFMGIQGLPAIGLAYSYMLTNPKQGTRMMAECIKAITYPVRAVFDPAWMFKYLAKLEPQALQRDSFGGSSVAVDFFEQAKRLGGPYPRFELAFFGAGEMIRNPFWEALEKEAKRDGNEFQLARFLDRLTGIISTETMGVSTTTRQLESSFIWFAPRYTRACLALLSNTFRGGYTGAQARRALGGMVMAGVLMFSVTSFGLSKLQGKDDEEAWKDILEGFGVVKDPITGEWDWKPSARMMSFKVGNYHFGIGGFWYGLVRLAGNIMATIEQVGDKERIDLVRILKYGSLNRRDNPFISWWFSRSSPLTGLGFQVGWPLLKSTLSGELQGGRDFFGYPIETWQEYLTYGITRFEPIWLEQALNPYIPWAAKDYEIPEGVAKVAVPVLEIFGWRSFPEYGWERFYNKLNEVLPHLHEDVLREYFTDEEMVKILEAQEKGELGYAQLPRALRQRLLGMYPELKELYEQALADNALRNSPPWKQWDAQVKAERNSYYGRGDNLIEQLGAGEIDTRELRERWSEAGATYGSALDTIENTPFYKQIFDYWEKREAQGVKYDMFFFLAENEYDEVMFAEYLDYKGDMDWDARDEAVDAYIEKWGVDVYEAIRKGFAARKIDAGLSPALVRLSEDKDELGRGYWRLPYKPIIKMDEDDEVKNNIPPEFYALWKQHQTLETDEEREAFIEANPDMAKDWRDEYRLAHPEEDARLALWGYGGKLQSREAYDLVAQWGQELGIPLETMGLGLPPRVLIEDYFTYNKTEGATERKWFRQEHPEFETWGVETYGWKPIDEQSVTPRNIDKLLQQYNEAEEGKTRLVFRHEHPELETWLVEEKGYTPVGDRWE